MIFPLLFWHRSTQNTVKLAFVPCPPAIIPSTPPSSQLINDNPTLKCEYAIELLCKSLETSVSYQFYPQNILRIFDSHFVPILTLRRDNSGIVPCKVRILTLSANLGILTLRRAIPELSRFSLCAEHIYLGLQYEGPWLKGQPSPLELIYSHCLIRFNTSSENNDFGCWVLKKSTFQNVSNLNALESKFDLAVK